MKPHILIALTKELHLYVKDIPELDRKTLLQINRRVIKIQTEIAETLEKMD
jgi:hypothetical protein